MSSRQLWHTHWVEKGACEPHTGCLFALSEPQEAAARHFDKILEPDADKMLAKLRVLASLVRLIALLAAAILLADL